MSKGAYQVVVNTWTDDGQSVDVMMERCTFKQGINLSDSLRRLLATWDYDEEYDIYSKGGTDILVRVKWIGKAK